MESPTKNKRATRITVNPDPSKFTKQNSLSNNVDKTVYFLIKRSFSKPDSVQQCSYQTQFNITFYFL